jgi:hypothetical protein
VNPVAGSLIRKERIGSAPASSKTPYFTNAAVLFAGLSLVAAANLMGQDSLGYIPSKATAALAKQGVTVPAVSIACPSQSISALVKQGACVSAGNVLVRLDSLSDSINLSICGPDGVFSKVEPLSLNVWKIYRVGKIELLIEATNYGKDVLLSIVR